jgi:outer membrane protein assembly factor BamB
LPFAVVALAIVAGCSDGPETDPIAASNLPGDWPIYRGNPGLHGVAAGTLGDRLELAWSFETGGAIISSPVVVEGIAYFGSTDGSVYAVDVASGEKLWSYVTFDIVDSPPLVHNGRVYVGSYDFFFYALDAASGELVWKYETDDKIVGGANWIRSPDGGTQILVGSYDNRLYCFDAESGEKLWEYETDNFINGTPAISNGRVVLGGCDTVLHVVSAVTGEPIDLVDLGPDSHVIGSAALSGDRAYLGHYGNAFVCIDLEVGEQVWSYPSRQQFYSSPAIGPDRVVFGGRDGAMHCVRRSDGEPLWSFATSRKIDSSPVICGDKVVFGSGDGRIYMLNLSDGEEVWKYDVGQQINSSPAVAEGLILIGANDGRLYAFRPPIEDGR